MQVHNPLTDLVFTSEQYGLEQVIINSSHKFIFLIKWGFLIETIVSLPLLQVFGNRLYLVGNKTNGRISKVLFQKNKVRQIFRKRTFLTP